MSRKLYVLLFLSPFVLSATLALTILIFFRSLPPRLPLFYSLRWGEEQLATHQQFLIIPASIILICLLNLTIAQGLHSSQVFFKKILHFSSMVASLILTITFIKISLMFF